MSAPISLKAHPLWKFVEASLNDPSPFTGEDQAWRDIYNCTKNDRFFGAFSLFLAMVGDRFCESFDPQELSLLERFVSESPFGLAVGTCALIARGSLCSFPPFSASLCLDGFASAVCVWSATRSARGEPDWKLLLSSGWRGNGTKHDELLFDLCRKAAPNSLTFSNEIARLLKLRKDREKKMAARNLVPKRNRFKDELGSRWIVDALWCRSTQGILTKLDPKGKHLATDLDLIVADVSRLSLTASRCPLNETSIEKHESQIRDIVGS